MQSLLAAKPLVSTIQIGLVEPNTLYRDMLCQSLGSRPFSVVFACATPDVIPTGLRDLDVLLLCTPSPAELFGPDLTLDYWSALFPHTKLFLLTKSRAPRIIQTLVQEGLHGYGVWDAVALNDLHELLMRAHSGEQALCHVAAAALEQADSLAQPLTRTETRIVHMLASLGTGYGSGKRVAQSLNMAMGTFRSHTRNICLKVNASSLDEILQRCQDLGLISRYERSPA
jgi:DNA-binding NarL/FixJ family response regulator